MIYGSYFKVTPNSIGPRIACFPPPESNQVIQGHVFALTFPMLLYSTAISRKKK